MSYANKQLGMWAGMFDQNLRDKLDSVYERLQQKMPEITDDYIVTYIVDEAEKAGICTSGEASELREAFVHDNGLPTVISF